MFPETLYPKTASVLGAIQNVRILSDFYIAGGTGLALQLGHRKSIDLDFFTAKFPKRDLLLSALSEFSPTVTQEAEGTLDLQIDSVKVSFLAYPYELLEGTVPYQSIKIASVIDIGCMKLTAISSRGAKKDFIDLYFILKKFSLRELLLRFDTKFVTPSYSKMHLLKSLTYFEDAENDPNPDMIEMIQWDTIKTELERQVILLA